MSQSDNSSKDLLLTEIIITAQKRNEIIQDVPKSIITYSGEELSNVNLVTMNDLESYVPNLTVTEAAIGTNLLIRGIGSGVNQGFEQSVGTYVDGVYRGRAQQSRIPFLDISRVEVLRGPQTIIFGKDTIAGALNITTSKPTNVLQAEIRGLYELDSNQSLTAGYISGPLSSDVNGRLSFHMRDEDGLIENNTLGKTEAQREERLFRGTIDWNINENWDASVKAESSDFDVNGREIEIINDTTAQSGPFTGLNYSQILLLFGQHESVSNNTLDYKRSSNGDFNYNNTNELVLTANYYGWGDLTLTSISGYSNYDFQEQCDCDFTGGDVFSVYFTEDYKQLSQEFRLISPVDDQFTYILGLSLFKNELDFFDTIQITNNSVLLPVIDNLIGSGAGNLIGNTATPRNYKQQSNSQALFAQGTWEITDNTRLTLGARFTREEKSGSRNLEITQLSYEPIPPPIEPFVNGLYAQLFNVRNHNLNGKRSRRNFLPSIRLQYSHSDNMMSYISFSKGEKSGGFDARSNNTPMNGGAFEFDDEKANSFELGTKHSFLDGSAEFNVAIYHTNFDDMQVSNFDGVLGFNVGNAARSTAQGIELDGRWRLTENLAISGAMAYSDFEYKEYNGQCYFGKVPDSPDGKSCDFSGMTSQFLPDYTLSLNINYQRPVFNRMLFIASLDVISTDDYFTTNTLDPKAIQESFTRLNGYLAIMPDDQKWEIAIIGKNLSDKEIISNAAEVPLAGSNFGTPGFFGFVQDHKTVAIQGTLRY